MTEKFGMVLFNYEINELFCLIKYLLYALNFSLNTTRNKQNQIISNQSILITLDMQSW